jgi:Low psii accumulation1 / Rep27
MPEPLNEEQLSRLRAEAKAPYRGIRRFFYIALGGSAFLGGFVFLMKAIAGENLERTLPNLLLQLAVCTIIVLLWRREQPPQP